MRCSRCGSDIGQGATRCSRCGADHSVEGERKLVTVMFADVAGFSVLAETLDPELLRDLLNELFDRLVPWVETFGGVVDKFMGDCLMALFGAPITHDDDAVRAVRAAVEMRHALESFNREKDARLAIHFGINTGRVVAGSVGGGGRRDYSVVGDAVNVAKRLEEASTAGEILIGPETRRLVADAFADEVAGTVRMRDGSEELIAYRITGERHSWGTPLSMRLSGSALVGREAEFEVFRSALCRLREGEGGAVLVLGEAGLGKSRLVAEARRDVCARDLAWAEGRTVSFGRTMSYLPFKEILQLDAGMLLQDGTAVRSRKLRARLDMLLGEESAGVLSHLANLLSLPVPEQFAQRRACMDEAGLRDELFERYARYLSGRSRERPLVVVIEDVHWLDASSAALVAHLLPKATELPILFCITGRPGAGSWSSGLRADAHRLLDDRFSEIVLKPLMPDEVEQLVAIVLESEDLPAGLLRMIAAKADGNPSFAEEIVKHLIEAGGLALGPDGRWYVTSKVSEVSIPGTVHGVIAARVDSLPEGTKRHLWLASVIGRAFSYRLLSVVSGDGGPALDRSLADLERHELVCRRKLQPEPVFAFKHALVQEATYESILLRQRREIHRGVAEAIEEIYPERLEELSGLLAYHCSKAEQWDRAQEYLLKAGERSATMAGDAEARGHYREAMAALLRAFDENRRVPGSEDPVDWFVQRMEPFWQTRQLPELLDSLEVFYEKVRAACGPGDPRTMTATCALADAYLQGGATAEVGRLLEPILEAPESACETAGAILPRALLTLGLARLDEARYVEAEALLSRVVELGRGSEDKSAEVLREAYAHLSTTYYFLGRLDEAREVLEEALARPDLGEGTPYWGFLLNLSSCCMIAGQWQQAAAHARLCLGEAPNPYIRAFAECHFGVALHAQGLLEWAEEHLRRSVETFQDLGQEYIAAVALKELAETQLQRGDPDGAEESAGRAIAGIERAGPGRLEAAAARWTLAGVALARGDLEGAERQLERARALVEARSPACDPLRSELFLRWAQLRRRQARSAEAEAFVDQAAGLIRDIGGDDHPRLISMRLEWEAHPALP